MKKTTAAERIAEACRGIIRRSDQIAALAEKPGAELSRIFSPKEIRVTNGICCELALSAPVGSLFMLREGGLLERYGDARFARDQVVAFVRKVYRESDPKTRSWAKTVKHVRTSADGRCEEIRKSVAGFAKPGEEGLEKAWNSICQQAKVLDERLKRRDDASSFERVI